MAQNFSLRKESELARFFLMRTTHVVKKTATTILVLAMNSSHTTSVPAYPNNAYNLNTDNGNINNDNKTNNNYVRLVRGGE